MLSVARSRTVTDHRRNLQICRSRHGKALQGCSGRWERNGLAAYRNQVRSAGRPLVGERRARTGSLVWGDGRSHKRGVIRGGSARLASLVVRAHCCVVSMRLGARVETRLPPGATVAWRGPSCVAGRTLVVTDARLRPADSCSGRESVNVPFRSSRSDAARSRGSVEERPVHTGKVAGSIPAGTTLFRIPPTTSSVGFTSSPRTAASIGQCPLHHRSSVFPARFVRSGRSCCFVSILVPVRPFTPVSFTACRPAPRREISQ